MVMLRAPLEVRMLCQRFRTLIISIQDSRLGLEKTKLVGKLANVDDFCSTSTDGNKLRVQPQKALCKQCFDCDLQYSRLYSCMLQTPILYTYATTRYM